MFNLKFNEYQRELNQNAACHVLYGQKVQYFGQCQVEEFYTAWLRDFWWLSLMSPHRFAAIIEWNKIILYYNHIGDQSFSLKDT